MGPSTCAMWTSSTQETFNDLNYWKTSAASSVYLIDPQQTRSQKQKKKSQKAKSTRALSSHHNNHNHSHN